MSIPLRFRLNSSVDGSSPASGTPAVRLWTPGAPGGNWFAPAAAPVPAGGAWWTVPASDSDQAGGSPLLLYATASDADPCVPWPSFPDGRAWTVGDLSLPLPVWLGTVASGDLLPAPGLSPVVSLSVNGAALAPGGGSVTEPGGAGNGNGWYLYYPTAAEFAAEGDVALTATGGPSVVAWTADYPIVAATPIPTPTPTPTPIPTPTPTPTPIPTGPTGTALCITDPDLCTIITPAVSGSVAVVPPPNVGPPRVPVVVGSSIALPTQCRLRGTGAPAAYDPADSLSMRVYSAPSTAAPASLAFVPAAVPTFLGAAGAGAAQGQVLPVLHTADTLRMSAGNIYTLGVYRVPSGTPDLEEIARIVLPALSPALG